MSVNKDIEQILMKVQKPGRYVGGELNSVIKDKEKVDVRFAFCFPDVYEVGMSHLGMKILYSLINERENYWCERVFAPELDMEEQMFLRKIPLYASSPSAHLRPKSRALRPGWPPKRACGRSVRRWGHFYTCPPVFFSFLSDFWCIL